jgi:hypothetical protein
MHLPPVEFHSQWRDERGVSVSHAPLPLSVCRYMRADSVVLFWIQFLNCPCLGPAAGQNAAPRMRLAGTPGPWRLRVSHGIVGGLAGRVAAGPRRHCWGLETLPQVQVMMRPRLARARAGSTAARTPYMRALPAGAPSPRTGRRLSQLAPPCPSLACRPWSARKARKHAAFCAAATSTRQRVLQDEPAPARSAIKSSERLAADTPWQGCAWVQQTLAPPQGYGAQRWGWGACIGRETAATKQIAAQPQPSPGSLPGSSLLPRSSSLPSSSSLDG